MKSSDNRKTLSLNQDGTYSENLSSLFSNTTYYYVVVSKVDDVELNTDVKSFITSKYPETVDLGLSVKWRGWNVGATKPEEYGKEVDFIFLDITVPSGIPCGASKHPENPGLL